MDEEATIRDLLEEALNSGRTPGEVCADHPELLGAVQRRWLRIQDLARDLEHIFPTSGRASPQRDASHAGGQRELPRIPGYEVWSLIGHGGMGAVYKALHLKLDRVVAVKMLIGGDPAIARERAALLREARTAAGLGHRNIVEVFDAGEADGHPFFTMEFVEGGSLAEQFRGVPRPPREAAELVAVIATAVQAAHEKGVVHRDIKPGNILITADGIPKVSDFGLARSIGDGAATTGAARLGTPSYMAPEQALGSPDAFGPRVDVYALGALLYEAVTGRPPFRASSPLEIQRQVISDEPIPPSHINPRVPRDVETIALRCLQKRPSARYASAGELVADLRRFLAGEAIVARKTPAVVRAIKWTRRHPTVTTALAFSILVVVAGVVAAANSVAEAAASRRLVENALEEVERSQRASDWRGARPALVRASLHLGGDGPADLKARLATVQRADDVAARLDAARIARALASGSRESMSQTDRDYAALFRDACGATVEEAPETSAAKIMTSTISATMVGAMYDWMLCEPLAARRREWILAVLRIVDSDGGGWRDRSRDPNAWDDRSALARAISDSTVPGQPTDYLLWLSYRMRELGRDPTSFLRRVQAAHRTDFWANYVLAEALYGHREFDEAIRFFQAAIAIRPDVALAHNNLAKCLRNLNRHGESLDALQEALRLDSQALPVRGNLGMALMLLGRHAEALPHFEFGVRAQPGHVQFRVDFGNTLVALDRRDEAAEQLEAAARLDGGSYVTREALLTGLLRTNQGSRAVPIARAMIQGDPTRYASWDGVAEFLLFIGATKEYEATRTRLLDAFASTSDPIVCERLCRACALSPMSDPAIRFASAAIERAMERRDERSGI